MILQFDSLNQFMTMDGHGVYVWSALIVSGLFLAGLVINPLLRQRDVMLEIARDQDREKQREASKREKN
ncbi:MAG: heme exporter protein CcmD [Porticoccaceae bacterium]|nr:heme exporter protein CcmD [Porticoccaceae bacterium]MDG1474742.1 heme exporter protein CcmD [Porticoccaceae bacterium]